MIIALTDSDSSIKEYKIIKDEMERLAFVGDSFINTAVIMNLYFRTHGLLNEKEYDSKKIPTIKSSNIEKLIKEISL
jgi:dsRNA-specific ribonuclease